MSIGARTPLALLDSAAAARMFALVNDIDSYPRRFDWCRAAEVLERGDDRVVARLDLGIGGFHTWFTTENSLSPPHQNDMALRVGPFKRLQGRFEAPFGGIHPTGIALVPGLENRERRPGKEDGFG